MGLARLAENQLIRWKDRLLKLVGKLPDGDWHMVDVASGLMDKKPDRELWRAFERNELTFICGDDAKAEGKHVEQIELTLSQAATVTEGGLDQNDLREHAVGRWKYVKATTGVSVSNMDKAIKAVWEKLQWPERPPSVKSIFNWRKKLQGKSDPIAALYDKHHLKGWRDRFEKKQDFLGEIRKIRDDHFLQSNPRITITKTVDITQRRIRAVNSERPKSEHYPIPGRRLVQRIVDEKSKYQQVAARYGPDAAANRFRYSLGGIRTDEPLARCEVDHTVLAVILCDEDFIPWGRAQTSVAVDAGSRCLTGLYWGAEMPSIVSLSRCIRHCVAPKIDFLARFPNVKGSWDCFGVSQTYVIDNGLEEHAPALRQAVAQLGGATLELCGRKLAWHKPHVERFFRNQDLDLLQGLPGATMENFTRRCNFDPKRDLILRRSIFDKLLVKWAVDIYLRNPQPEVGNRAPIDLWKERIVKVDQFVPNKTVLLERLFLRKVENRRLDHEGIEYDCLNYNSPDMGAVRSQLGTVLKVTIWVSDEDLGYIQVEVPGTDFLIRVPCLELKYALGLTRWQHEKNKKAQRVAMGEGRQISIDQARQEIEDDIRAEISEFRHAHRKRRSRYQEKDPSRIESKTKADSVTGNTRRARKTTEKTPSPLSRSDDAPIPTLKSFVVQ